MMICSLKQTMSRIAGAEPDSPIAVFRTGVPDRFDTIFAESVSARQRIAVDPDYIGTFHGGMCQGEVKGALIVQEVPPPSPPRPARKRKPVHKPERPAQFSGAMTPADRGPDRKLSGPIRPDLHFDPIYE